MQMSLARRRTAASIMLVWVLGGVGSLAWGQQSPAVISVVGLGVARGKPTVVEIHASVSGEGELAADASVKHRDARRRALEALQALKIPSLAVESRGISLGQSPDAAIQMRQVQAAMPIEAVPKQKVAVVEQLRLVLKDADKLQQEKLMETVLRIVDAGRDNGLQIVSGASAVNFKIPEVAALRESAYKAAIADASARAERLAEFSNVKLGRITAIHDQDSTPDPRVRDQDGGLSSSTLGEIPLQARLLVHFEIAR